MDRNRVTVRYAKALIELATEQNQLDKVSLDIATMYAALDEYEGFSHHVLFPGYSSEEKFERVKSIFADQFSELSMNFLQLVFANNREEYLKDLCRNTIDMSLELRGIVSASLVTATKLDSSLMEKLKSTFEKKLNATLDLSSDTNPDLICGFVFTIDGQQYDASVASKLNAIKKQLQLK